MQRFSVMAPSGHFTLSTVDRMALANAVTPGETTDSRRSRARAAETLGFYQNNRHTKHFDTEQLPTIPPDFKPGMRFYLAFSSLAALSLVVALDGTSISVALPVMTKALNGSAIEGFWAGTSFLLCSTILQPIYASFSDIFGRKQMTLIAVALFLIGTLLAGIANTMTLELLGRSVQGAGASGIIALTSILITDLVPLRKRGSWVGILGAMWAIGSVSGPVIGGALAHPSSWRWIFYLNIPFIAVSFLMVACFVRLRNVPSTFMTKFCRADWVGSIVFIASTTAILIPLSWGGVQHPWSSWRVVVPIGFGHAGLVILAYHERFAASEPVIRSAVFANRTTNIAYLTTALHGMVLWCLLYYQPLYFEGVRGFTPIIAGVALFPATFTVAPAAIVTGLIIGRFGKFRWAVWLGWIMTTLGAGFLCAIDNDTQLTQVLLTDLLAGLGLGMLFPALQFQVQAASDPKNLAWAVSMFSFFRGLGQTIGIAIGGNIFQNVLESRLAALPAFASSAEDLAADATSLVVWLQNAPPGPERDAMRAAYTQSMRAVYIALAVVSLIATIASVFIRHYSIDQEMATQQDLVTEKKQTRKK